MKTNGIALIKKVSSLPSGSMLAEMSLLCGKDKDEKTRYLNGSFIFGEKTKGMVEVEIALKSANGESIMVQYEIADLHCESNVKDNKTYMNYRGFLRAISLHKPA